jgi:hypothetical protein
MLQPFHVVITDPGLLVVRAPNAHWRDLQDAFPSYVTSLGPFDLEALLDMVFSEWPNLAYREAELRAFAVSEDADVFDLEAPPSE